MGRQANLIYRIWEKQSRTIKSYVSAIKAVLKEDKIKICEDKYLLSSLTRACKVHNDQARIQFPIHRGLLKVLIKGVSTKYRIKQQQPCLDVLYWALFVTAYFGLFQFSAITKGSHIILAKDVHIAQNKKKLGDKPQIVKISASDCDQEQCSNIITCPFSILKEYLKLRKTYTFRNEPFFVFGDHSPMTPEQFRFTLKQILMENGYDDRFYKCHSFRIGRSQDLWKMGVPVNIINKSNSVYT